MSPVLSRRQRHDAPVEDEATTHEPAPIASGVDQAISTWSTKLATVGLYSCLVLGPLGVAIGAYALTQSGSGAPTVEQAVTADLSNARAVAGDFAQHVVVTWLTTTQENPDALQALVKEAPVGSVSKTAFIVNDPAIARVSHADGIWSVTVAATVTDANDVTSRRYFQVPIVLVDDHTVTALTLPTPVSPPTVQAGSSTLYRTHLDMNSPVAGAVTQFLTAYTAGNGDVSRYVTPGVELTALTPAPYAEIRLNDLRSTDDIDSAATPADGQQTRILATASAVVGESQSVSVTYALTITARAGRWEIAAIDPAPAVATQDSGAATAPAIVPTPAATSTDPTGSSPAPTP